MQFDANKHTCFHSSFVIQNSELTERYLLRFLIQIDNYPTGDHENSTDLFELNSFH